MLHRLLAVAFVVTPLLAQTAPPKPAPLTAKSFLVDDVVNQNHVDFALLRQTGVWDDLSVSVLKLAFQQIEKELGCPFAAIDRITMLAQFGPGEGMAEVKQITVTEGNRDLGMPPTIQGNQLWSSEKRADGLEIWRRSIGGGQAFVRPTPNVRVEGDEDLIDPVLAGTPWSHRQAPEVMSLLSGGQKNAVHVVLDLGHPMLRQSVLGQLMPDQEWPEDEGPQFGCLRIVVTGSEDDPHLGVVATLRHAKAGEGVKASQQAATALIERLSAMPAMRAAKATLAKTTITVDGSDVVMKLDLGRSRDAVGTLATVAAPLFARATRVEQVEVVEPPPPPEAKTEPKKEAPKKDEKPSAPK